MFANTSKNFSSNVPHHGHVHRNSLTQPLICGRKTDNQAIFLFICKLTPEKLRYHQNLWFCSFLNSPLESWFIFLICVLLGSSTRQVRRKSTGPASGRSVRGKSSGYTVDAACSQLSMGGRYCLLMAPRLIPRRRPVLNCREASCNHNTTKVILKILSNRFNII